MKVTILHAGEPHECDVAEGESIASAAERIGIKLLGSCGGHGICCQCSREVVMGMEHLLNTQTQKPAIPDGYAPYVRTCSTTPTAAGVIIDANKKARLT